MEMEAVTESVKSDEMNLVLEPEPQAIFGQGESAANAVGGELGKDEFLTLLTTQLTHQDPMDPMNSTDMVAQLAQFSALEQMENLNGQFEEFREQSLIQALFVLQGQNVSLELVDGSTAEGQVEKIFWSSDAMQLQVAGETYSLDNITGITMTNQETAEELTEEPAVTAEG